MPNSRPVAGDAGESIARTRLRAMRERDLDQVLVIEEHCFTSPWVREHFLHELRDNRWAHNWVIERDGEVLAYLCAWILGPELKINNLAVRQDRRRSGLGTRMLRAVIEVARRRGCRAATLEVRPSNRAAITLYERFGFVEIGRRSNYYEREGEDALLMAARIGPRGPAVGR